MYCSERCCDYKCWNTRCWLKGEFIYTPLYFFGFVPNNSGINVKSCSFYLDERTKTFKNIFNLLPFFGIGKYRFFPVRNIKLPGALTCAVQTYFLNSCPAGKYSPSSPNLPRTSREEEQLDDPGDPVLLETPLDSYRKPPKVNLMLPSCLSAACRSSLPE